MVRRQSPLKVRRQSPVEAAKFPATSPVITYGSTSERTEAAARSAGELQAELEGSMRAYTAAEDAQEIEALMNQWGGMLPRDPMREGVTSLVAHGPLLVTGNFKGQLVARDYRDCVKERFDPSRGTLEGSSRLVHGRSKFWATDDNEEDVDALGCV
ncbi:hypothetical protein CYMTET_18082 [Cymbomonas tetramitiformis]|uniref:Rhodanese domain-containing protein n=1 Tax=Cymbomonas tetramitiformis TaxID=36881 RepID=A0AAE0G8V2_9CHLO|nr:hypothetical protein CYMTET_18082 [Cymbomonas tetramitiformis]